MLAVLLTLALDMSQIVDKDAKVEKVSSGHGFTEGAAWTRDGKLVFSDISGNKLHAIVDGKVEVFRDPSGNVNGNIVGPDGLLYTAGHGSRNITRTNKNGTIAVIADKFEGKRLNSPNDLVFLKNGDLYFTDPAYGLGRAPAELDFKGVFLLRKNGKLEALVRDFETPNGIVFSPDEKLCYVADTNKRHVRVFDVASDGTLRNGRMFAEKVDGFPDGMRVDTQGNLYIAANGIQVYSPKGECLGSIPVPETPSNCAWGDKDAKGLCITARTSVYKVRCKIKGVRF